MAALTKYDAACRAIAAARSVDEVKLIRDKSIAIKAYARQAKNKEMEADAFEIRVRAERRLGEMMAAQPKAKPPKFNGPRRVIKKPDEAISLAAAGIDKNLAHRARTLNAMPTEKFEELVAEGREDVKRSVERSVMAKARRQEKHQSIAARAGTANRISGRFPLILADPPWKWGHFGEVDKENERGKGRTPDQHYPTMSYADICDFSIGGRSISQIAHKDAALFLWCTSANIDLALKVMNAWDFQYKAHAVWVKIADGNLQNGMGLVFRNAHEVLLYGTRGKMPGPQHQPKSVFLFPRGRHSAKPPEIRKVIERMYPDFDEQTRLELFARETVPGWTAYGFEASDNAAS